MTFNTTSAANGKEGGGVKKVGNISQRKNNIVHIINNKIPMNCYTRQQSRGLV